MGAILNYPELAGVVEARCQAPEDDCWFDSARRRFWHRSDSGQWVDKSESQMIRWLIDRGVSPNPDGQPLKPIERKLLDIETNHVVDYAGPYAGRRAGVFDDGYGRLLVTRELQLIEPLKPGVEPDSMMDCKGWGWPTLGWFLKGLLIGEEEAGDGEWVVYDQFEKFLVWVQYAVQSLHYAEYTTDMCLVLAGETNCGKTLLDRILEALLGGVSEDPFEYMAGGDDFNGELLKTCLLSVDDKSSDSSIKTRKRLAAMVKQFVAAGKLRLRLMRTEAMRVRPISRLYFATNVNPDALKVLPPLSDDVRDKMLILKGYRNPELNPNMALKERQLFWKTLTQEFGYFVNWLLNVYKPSDELKGRFGGAVAWQHPIIKEHLDEGSPVHQTWEFVQRLVERHGRYLDAEEMIALGCHKQAFNGLKGLCLPASGYRTALLEDGDDAVLNGHERRDVRRAEHLGSDLAELEKSEPRRVFGGRVGKQRSWIVLANEFEGELTGLHEWTRTKGARKGGHQ